jgi:hypothetical protein
VKLAARVSEALGVQLSVITVFRHPTIQQLAKQVESLKLAGISVKPKVVEFEEGSI